MRLLLKSASFVLIGLLISVSTATLFARHLPESERIAMLHLDACEPPCWIGITPDQTSIVEAEKRLRETFTSPYQVVKSSLSSDRETNFEIYLRGEPAFSVGFLHPESETVLLMSLYFEEGSGAKYRNYTLAELHTALGVPQYLLMNYVSSLVYTRANGAVTIDGYNTDLDTPMKTRLARSITFYGKLDTNQLGLGFMKWKGFVPLQHYADSMCMQRC